MLTIYSDDHRLHHGRCELIDGKLMPGRFGNSGEFAAVLPYNIYAQPNLESLRHCISLRGTDLSSVHDLVTRFDPAWPGIDDWIAKVKDSLSLVASSCSAILDTEAIVLGGNEKLNDANTGFAF